jgi:SAM-dependent methyltransferase
VQGYILDLAKKERFSKERLLGVAFDGNYFLFMRHTKRWIQDEPVPLNEKSLELFLKNLEKLTSKAALIPENLIRDFAVGKDSRNKVAVDCIKAFYSEISKHGDKEDTKEHVFFKQWKIQFAEVHGSLEQKKFDRKTLFTSYGFSKKEQQNLNVLAFFFALDSYYALLIKLLSYQVVGFYTLKDLTGLPLHDWGNLSSENLRQKCEELEEGGIFRNLGIRNFLEGDLFGWYTQAWNDEIFKAIKQIINHLNDYDPETMEIAPDETRDILKKLYQYLVPKQIRHDLGEYYTPDWLAERCLNQLSYNGDPKYRILDPGCGSGTFPILAIKRAKDYALKHDIPPTEVLKNVLRNIHGFDLNPLAVISARTNYMLAIADLLKYRSGEIIIPIYFCDSINPPEARIADEMTLFEKKMPHEVKTTVGNFLFPHSIITKQRVQELANIMEDCVKSGTSVEAFLKKVENDLKLDKEEYGESELYLEDTYEQLVKLDQRGINGVWARIIKNAFAPLFVGKFDMVVGNPPWVNWEALPEGYRDETKPLWIDYGLFSLSGNEARLGGGKKDLSMLMMYVSINKYLKENGKLCFVITQSLFKSTGAGEGFRRFQIGKKRQYFKVEHVDDMVNLQPFEGASNRTSVVLVVKNKTTNYPVPYTIWHKIQRGKFSIDYTIKEVISKTKRLNFKAKPIQGDITSSWITGRGKTIDALTRLCGKSYYDAFEGANNGGLAGAYWVHLIKIENNLVEIENLYDAGKKIVKQYHCLIEEDIIFPLLRWGNMKKWFAQPKHAMVIPQDPDTRMGYKEEWIKSNLPRTYNYLKHFEKKLWHRKSKTILDIMHKSAFYAIFGVSKYTFSKYKVCWQTMGGKLRAAVISNSDLGGKFPFPKTIVPQHTIVFIPSEYLTKSHFICALINSSTSDLMARSYSMGKSFGNPHLMNQIPIPDPSNSIHQDLSRLSQQCHEKTAAGIDVTDLEEQIDELAAEMWELTCEELKDIKNSLEELR